MKVDISKDVLKAISTVISYNFESVADHYEECLDQGADVSKHIYNYVVKIHKWIGILESKKNKGRKKI